MIENRDAKLAKDIGKQNALDKIIGYALTNKIDFGNTFDSPTRQIFTIAIT